MEKEEIFATGEVEWTATQNGKQFKISPASCNTDQKEENLSFWKDVPIFHSSIDSEICSDPINKFVIQKIVVESNGKKILFGEKQIAIVSGIFSESEFEVGQKVDVFPCLCCIGSNKNYKENTESLSIYEEASEADVIRDGNNLADDKVDTSRVNDKGKDYVTKNKADTNISHINTIHSKENYNKKSEKIPHGNINYIHSPAISKKVKIDPNCYIYDSPEFKNKVIFHVNNENNAIVIEDDVLTVTAFCSSIECINNPLLSKLIADFSFEYSHPSLAIGIIIHAVIQSSLLTKQSSFSFLVSESKRIIKENLFQLYSCNMSDKEAINEVMKHMQSIIAFVTKGFNVQKIEHRVYSSCYGLKGQIDCLDTNYVIEIKSGKYLSSLHRSQAILYTILLLEQNLKKDHADYNQFLFDISSLMGTGLNTNTNQNFNFSEMGLKPLLYYVKSGEYVKIDLRHEEISYLLKIRNDIACNKAINTCDCPENYPCSIINKIKQLPISHFLRIQYEGIENEAKRPRVFYKGVKMSQIKNKVVYKTFSKLLPNEYCYLFSISEKFICTGMVVSFSSNLITINLNEDINTDKIILICLENDTNFLKYMRWSLINVAYFKYLKKDIKGHGIDSFYLPGQINGLEPVKNIEHHSDDIEMSSINFESDFISFSNEADDTKREADVSFDIIDIANVCENIVESDEKKQKIFSRNKICNDEKLKNLENIKNIEKNTCSNEDSFTFSGSDTRNDSKITKLKNLEFTDCPNVTEYKATAKGREAEEVSSIKSRFLDDIFSNSVEDEISSIENMRGFSDILSSFEPSEVSEFSDVKDKTTRNIIKEEENSIPLVQKEDNFMATESNTYNVDALAKKISNANMVIDDTNNGKYSKVSHKKQVNETINPIGNNLEKYNSEQIKNENINNIVCSQTGNESHPKFSFGSEDVDRKLNFQNSINSEDSRRLISASGMSGDEIVFERIDNKSLENQHLYNSRSPKPKVLFNSHESSSSFQYFTPCAQSIPQSFKYWIPDVYKNEFLKLNEDQRSALFTSLNCENFRIIHGMPGTGKSTVISLLIKILIHYKQKVLFICYTHLAIKNVLDKLGSLNYYYAKKETKTFNTSEEIVKYFDKLDMVAGTCYSLNDPVYIKRRFDYCIIDEGSQIHLLLALIPISISERFCMVGDHLQLKPLCKRSQELSLSLFEYLKDGCSLLTQQYRMGDSIMKLSNTLFYDNKLKGFGGCSTVEFINLPSINFKDYMCSLKDITVLCYFNVKVKEVLELNKKLTVTTIDRFQGSENDDILVIFDPIEKCDVIESSERLNVALTRARKKLYLLGDKSEMAKIELFERLLKMI